MADDDVHVRDDATAHRFEILVGDAVAGFAEYHDRGDSRAFTHTVVDDAFEGRGLGSRLVRAVLDDARAHGRAVLPFCQFVRSYVAEHADEYVDLVPADERARFDLA